MMLLAGSIVLHQQSPGAIGVCLKMANCVFHLKWLLTAKPNLWLGCHYTATAGPGGILSNTGGAGGEPYLSDPCLLSCYSCETLWKIRCPKVDLQK